MKIALDPTPFHHSHSLFEFPRVVADLGYKYMQMTPHADFIPFYNHPKADDELVGQLKKASKDAAPSSVLRASWTENGMLVLHEQQSGSNTSDLGSDDAGSLRQQALSIFNLAGGNKKK